MTITAASPSDRRAEDEDFRIDTTGQTASAALVGGRWLIAEFTMNYKLTHSQTILPMIADILERTKRTRQALTALPVPAAQAGYGAEIGAATAKKLRLRGQTYCCRSTLDALAYNVV